MIAIANRFNTGRRYRNYGYDRSSDGGDRGPRGWLLMHGIVMKGLKDFVVEQYDRPTWFDIKDAATDQSSTYLPLREYPDEEAIAIVGEVSERTNVPSDTLLKAFGEYLASDLLSVYGIYVDDSWSAIELVGSVEEYIHTALRKRRISEFTPPELESQWMDDDRVMVRYTSDRQLCSLAIGLLLGIADHYDTEFVIHEPLCMHEGDDCCELIITQQTTPQPAPSTPEPDSDGETAERDAAEEFNWASLRN